MKKFLIIVQKNRHRSSAYPPDVPGCVATGRTGQEIEQNMRVAIEFHLEGLRAPHWMATPSSSASCSIIGIFSTFSEKTRS